MKRRTRALWILALAILAVLVLVRTTGPVARVLEHWPAIQAVAAEVGADPFLLAALVHAESSGDAAASIPGGPVGLLQITPEAARDAAGGREVSPEELRDPLANLRLGAGYLMLMRTRFGDETLALAAFRLGPGRIGREVQEAGGAEAFLGGFRSHPAWLYVSKVRQLKELYRSQVGM